MKLKSVVVVPSKNKCNLFSKPQPEKNKSRVKKILKKVRKRKAAIQRKEDLSNS